MILDYIGGKAYKNGKEVDITNSYKFIDGEKNIVHIFTSEDEYNSFMEKYINENYSKLFPISSEPDNGQ